MLKRFIFKMPPAPVSLVFLRVVKLARIQCEHIKAYFKLRRVRLPVVLNKIPVLTADVFYTNGVICCFQKHFYSSRIFDLSCKNQKSGGGERHFGSSLEYKKAALIADTPLMVNGSPAKAATLFWQTVCA
jgi:hypothetical protein